MPTDPSSLRERLQQRLAAVGTCPRPAVSALAHALEDRYERALGGVGLNIAQFTLLTAIGYAGETSITGLTKLVARDQTTLSRGVDKLRAQGWVEMARPEENRRIHLVRLSEAGAAKVEEALTVWQGVRDELDAHLGVEHITLLREIAWKAVAALRAAEGQAHPREPRSPDNPGT